jgi:hypothetical protein
MTFVVIGIAVVAGGSLGLNRLLGTLLRGGSPAATVNPMIAFRMD